MGDMISITDQLADENIWHGFLEYKRNQPGASSDFKEIEAFIKDKGYLSVISDIGNDRFPLPRKKIISKMSTQKKRTVYVYPRAHTIVLKLITYLMIRRYDHLFGNNLYSFRPSLGSGDAIRHLTSVPDMEGFYSYKVDISDYFNSVNTGMFLPMLHEILSDDPELYGFLAKLLTEEHVIWKDEIISERKGIMAGTPIASFFANIYLMEMDKHFEHMKIPYARYSDDIIIFSKDEKELQEHIGYIREFLCHRGLEVNHNKEEYSEPGGKWTFLGFSYENGTIDISPVSIHKIKGKMRRKARALRRWGDRNDIAGERCAGAFIRIFNRKLLESSEDKDLTWSFWYFPVINTDKGLHEIDRYAQDTIRYLISGRRNKGRYKVRYEDLKKLGYKSLVNEYYKFGS